MGRYQRIEAEPYGFLKKGRIPFAKAFLESREGQTARAAVFFFDTPAGVMVSASAAGLTPGGGVYGFCVCDGAGCSGLTPRPCRYLPLLYEKQGEGHGSLVSEDLGRAELRGRRILLRQSDAGGLCGSLIVAEGFIQ